MSSAVFHRSFSSYDGQNVTDDQLIKKSDDWVIEETNFCLGRRTWPRFKETDDTARRVMQLQDSQLVRLHTRLRDGTCIPVMAMCLIDLSERPAAEHMFWEHPIVKYTWDETYDDAWEDEPPTAKVEAKPVPKLAAKAQKEEKLLEEH